MRDVSVIDAVGYALYFGGLASMSVRAPWYIVVGLPVLGTAVFIVGAELRRRGRY